LYYYLLIAYSSIVFGPHCLKKREADPVTELTDSKVIYESVQLMIEEYEAIFSVSLRVRGGKKERGEEGRQIKGQFTNTYQDIAAEREGVRKRRAQQQVFISLRSSIPLPLFLLPLPLFAFSPSFH
jgi:hypothetical protein